MGKDLCYLIHDVFTTLEDPDLEVATALGCYTTQAMSFEPAITKSKILSDKNIPLDKLRQIGYPMAFELSFKNRLEIFHAKYSQGG